MPLIEVSTYQRWIENVADRIDPLVSASKPNPEIFLRAAEALGTARDRTLVLEDSYNGVRAGAAGGFVTTVWNKPDDLHPWDFGNNYVAHMSFDGAPAGQQTADALFEAMGGSGGIVALGGIPSNVPAIQRKAGLMEAIKANGKVELLDFQDADWDATKANNIVSAWITRFGSDIKGIWAANDGMAIGALEALRAEGLAGQVPVTGIDGTKDAVTAVKNGEMAATVDWDPFWIGGIALSLSYHAATGAITPEKEPKDHREFYATGKLIGKADIEEYWKTHIETSPPAPDWNDLWGRFDKAIAG